MMRQWSHTLCWVKESSWLFWTKVSHHLLQVELRESRCPASLSRPRSCDSQVDSFSQVWTVGLLWSLPPGPGRCFALGFKCCSWPWCGPRPAPLTCCQSPEKSAFSEQHLPCSDSSSHASFDSHQTGRQLYSTTPSFSVCSPWPVDHIVG